MTHTVVERFSRTQKPANPHHDRIWALNFISTWSDDMFDRQFRLNRSMVTMIVEMIKESKPTYSEAVHYK